MKKSYKIQGLILKISSRCNINCTYCYMYNMGDSTYKSMPKFMSDTTVDNILEKTLLHCKKHKIQHFEFIFHGGEPLLAPKNFFTQFTLKCNNLFLPNGISIRYILQTNGILLTDDWCQLFKDLDINIGISLDGYEEVNDSNRIDKKGRGTYKDVVKGLKIAQKYLNLGRGPNVLCVININSDPIQLYEEFQRLGVKSYDLLLPDSNHDKLPPKSFLNYSQTPYADWLIEIFDMWWGTKGKQLEEKPKIRIFNTIIGLILGISQGDETFGKGNNEFAVIETNGGIEAVDVLKICGEGFTKNECNINTTELDSAFNTNLAMLYHLSHKYLCEKCKSCPIVEICGGGYIPHRYSSSRGFNNPSVYCDDLIKLITHIQNNVIDYLVHFKGSSLGLSKITNEEVLEHFDSSQYIRNTSKEINFLESFKEQRAVLEYS